MPGVRLFVNRDMAAGTTPERAARALEVLAELHAGFWGWTRRAARGPAPARAAPVPLAAAARGVARAQRRGDRAVPLTRARGLLAGARRAVPARDRALGSPDRGLVCAVRSRSSHGDSHLGNLFEIDTPDGPAMGMLDFQAVHWSKGMRDVQYFLINSLAPDVLASTSRA